MKNFTVGNWFPLWLFGYKERQDEYLIFFLSSDCLNNNSLDSSKSDLWVVGFNFSFEYYFELMYLKLFSVLHTTEVITLFDAQIVPFLASAGDFQIGSRDLLTCSSRVFEFPSSSGTFSAPVSMNQLCLQGLARFLSSQIKKWSNMVEGCLLED